MSSQNPDSRRIDLPAMLLRMAGIAGVAALLAWAAQRVSGPACRSLRNAQEPCVRYLPAG